MVLFFLPKITYEPAGFLKSKNTPVPSVRPTEITNLEWPAGQTVNPKILMYHHIGPLPADADDIRKGLTVSQNNFESQIKYLKDNGYQIKTLSKLFEMVAGGQDVSHVAVLTFDDGYDDNYNYAWPILKKYNVSGTFFIISKKIGETEYMSESQVRELSQAGGEIGSHSVSHPDLSKLSKSKVQAEVEKSKEDLETLTGRKVTSFCYPAGKFSTDVENAAKSAGYKIAVTTQKGAPFSTDNPFEVPRYRINPTTNLSNLF